LLVQHAAEPVLIIEITSESDDELEAESRMNENKSAAAASSGGASSRGASTILSPHARKRAPCADEAVESDVEKGARESKRAKSGATELGPKVNPGVKLHNYFSCGAYLVAFANMHAEYCDFNFAIVFDSGYPLHTTPSLDQKLMNCCESRAQICIIFVY
jgi:hypothetical protein